MEENKESQQERPAELLELEKKFGFNAIKSNLTRARSLTVGTHFNGCYEVGIRADDGTYYYSVITPNDFPFIKKMFSIFDEDEKVERTCPENSGS
ncbi:MAG: hypothetical protein EBS24_08595 [Chitinophagia bacterium]|nr:hypothetical protein [Chitinophagia bacterium]